MSLVINCDMDGVVYDFNAAITSAGELALGRKLPQHSDTWNMWDLWEIGRNEWYEIFHEAIMTGEVFNQRALDISGAVVSLRRLIDAGHRVRMVTSKKLKYPESTAAAQIQTIRWLKYHGLLNDVELSFAHDKQGYLADVIIDDKPNLKWVQSRSLNLLFDQPWNRSVVTAEPRWYRLVRVMDWKEIVDLISMLEQPNDLGEGAGGG